MGKGGPFLLTFVKTRTNDGLIVFTVHGSPELASSSRKPKQQVNYLQPLCTITNISTKYTNPTTARFCIRRH